MNKQSIDLLIERTPKIKMYRHTLEKMQPGAYCIHKSWGFGKIKSYNETTNKLIIDFQDGKDGHAMDPAFCVDKLEILNEDHILVRQQNEPDTISDLIKNQPVEVVIEILSMNPNGTMSTVELEMLLIRLVGEAKFKKWWSNVKKLLIKDPRIGVPVKKLDPYVLRDEPMTPEQEILEDFYSNKKPLKKILLAEKLYLLSDSAEEIANDLPQILEELTDAIKTAKRGLTQAERLHGLWVRNDLARYLNEDVENLEPTSGSLLKETENLSELAEVLPANYHGRFLDLISRTFPDTWDQIVIGLLKDSVGKFTSDCITFLMERDCTELIIDSFNKWLNEQTFKGPVLHWIIKNRNTRRFHRIVKDLMTPRLLSVVFHAIDTEALQSTGNRRILLGDCLSEDATLISDLLTGTSLETAKDLAQSLMHNQGFEPLTKRSLMARFIKQFPEIQSLISGDETSREDDSLLVSEFSMEKKKEEYELLINKKIPENKQAIATAREHGDLRENSEYKMARQDQDMLLARKALLETEMSKARVTDFKNVTDDKVGVGSLVTLVEGSSKSEHQYAILGAWDSDPDKNILSYKTPLGQSVMGKQVDDKITLDVDGNEEVWTIKKIGRWVEQKARLK